jgi:dolichol-phosphate mannosyltransferase
MLPDFIQRHLTPERKRFVKFGIVGASGVVVNLLFVWASLTLLEAFEVACAAGGDGAVCGLSDAQKAIASAVGIGLSVGTNFLLNDWWTWGDRTKGVRKRDFLARIARYYLASGLAVAIQYGAAMGMVLAIDTNLYMGQLVGIALGTVVNFVINNVWTFKDKEVAEPLSDPIMEPSEPQPPTS